MSGFRLKTGDDGYERVVYAELLIPDYLNSHGDLHSERSVREFAYAFAIAGYGLDVEHDNVDVAEQKKAHVVESFIARKGDPDFIEGSWVIGMYIPDDVLWDKVKNNELNGFSHESIMTMLPVELDSEFMNTATGTTEPDLNDGHYHKFVVIVDDNGNPIAGGTDVVDGHSHNIVRATFTAESNDHVHIYNYV